MKDDADQFNQISGTNGIMGAADTILLITKKQRSDGRAVLKITGRDVESADLVMELDLQTTYRWRVISTVEQEEADQEREAYESDPVVKTIKGLLAISPMGIELTAREFMMNMTTYADAIITERAIGQTFRRLEPELYNRDKIIHKIARTGAKGRRHIFQKKGIVYTLPLDTNGTNDT